MNILVIGKTKSGKTTFSRKIAEKLNFDVHSMGEMFRNSEKDNDKLTNNSKKMIEDDWDCNIKYIENKFGKSIDEIDNVVFEGFRNPYEFQKFFKQDTVVIHLEPYFIDYKDDFERDGIDAIKSYLNWFDSHLNHNKVVSIGYSNYNHLELISEDMSIFVDTI